MAKRNNEDEDEFEGIRPGDIDDVFELDDEGFDIETDNPGEEDYLDSETNEDDDDYSEYMIGNESENNDEIPDVEENVEEEKEELIEDMIDNETAKKSEEPIQEVSLESIKNKFINSKINNENDLLDVLSDLKNEAFDNDIEIPSVEIMKDRTMEYLNEKGYIPVDDPKAIEYIFNNEDNVLVEPEPTPVEETDVSTETVEVKSEEDLSVVEPIATDEGPNNVNEVPGGSEIPEQFKDEPENNVQPNEEQPQTDTEDTVATVEVPEESEAVKEIAEDLEGDKLSEVETSEPIRDEYQEKVDEGERTSQEEIPDEIKNIVEEEIEEKEKPISESEIPDEIKEIAKDVSTDDMPEIETPSDAKNKREKDEQDAKETKSEEDYAAFMVEGFKDRVKKIYDRYTEDDLLNYIKDFADKDNKEVIKDIYIQEFVKYSSFIDFNSIPEAKQHLWVLVVGEFADIIEGYKHSGSIESEVIPDEHGVSNDIVPDENIESIKAHKRQQDERYAEYKLDRTIFNISEDDDEANCSIFDDKKTLYKDFGESEFYKIHKEVMATDRFADMSKIRAEVIINEKSSFIPIIDYSSGVRVFCIDPTDTDQFHLNPMLMHRNIPFSFKGVKGIKTRVLYRDDCKNRPFAVISALKKIIAFKYIKDRYKISLNRNYTIGYTTEPKYIQMFNCGDPDSHSPENCTTAHEKPFNLQIGIIILDKKSDNDRRAIRRNQIKRDLGKFEKVAVEDYNIQFVLSANIIKNDLRLRNPTLPAEERYVEYLITQYNECNPVIIEDGLNVITACIIKEHIRNYDAGTGYSIAFEYDRDSLLSPAIIAMLDERDGMTPTMGAKVNMLDVDGQFILPQSRLKLDGVFAFEKGRIDKRFFSPATIQRKYPRELWQNYDLSTRDGRIEFIRSRGFEEFIHMKPVQFDIEPWALNAIYSSDMLRNITRISMEMLVDRNSEDTEALLFKQSELEYIKSMGNTKVGTFQKFLFAAMDYILDQYSTSNKERR